MSSRHFVKFDAEDIAALRKVLEEHPTATAVEIGVMLVQKHRWSEKHGLSRNDHQGLKSRVTRLCSKNNILLPQAPEKKTGRVSRPPARGRGLRPRGGHKVTLETLPSLAEL